MAGRWKVGRDGKPEWEEGVTGPNQIEPPQQAPAQQSPLIAGAQQDFPTNYLPPAPTTSNFYTPYSPQQSQGGYDDYGTAMGNWPQSYAQPATPQQSPSAPSTGSGDWRRDQVAGWYKELLGREGSEQEYGHWMNQPGNLSSYRQNIANSPEAQAYRSRPQPQAQPQQSQGAGGYNQGALSSLIMASGGVTGPELQALIASRPDIASGVTVFGSKGDKLRFPDGSWADVNIGTGAGLRQPSFQLHGANETDGGFGGMAPSSMLANFSDPLTAQYEQMLQAQTGLYQSQQGQMQQQAAQAQQTRAATAAAVQKLTEFLNQRVGQLQQPAYTGAEAETMRTRALDPIEQDRTAAQQRALQRISARGLTPESGIAMQLQNDVDATFDQARAGAQNELGYRQITEERSRQQEAQGLLQMLAQLPDAVARGDMDFVNYVTQLINQPGQQGLATSALLADLPVQRTQLGLQVLGQGGSPMSAFGGAASLLQNAQSQRYLDSQNRSSYLEGLGQLLGYTLGY